MQEIGLFDIDDNKLIQELKIFKEYDQFGEINDDEYVILDDNKERIIYYSFIISNYDN